MGYFYSLRGWLEVKPDNFDRVIDVLKSLQSSHPTSPTMTTEQLKLLLLLLLGLLPFIGGLLPNAVDKQKSLRGRCFLSGLGVVFGVLFFVASGLSATPQAEQNAAWLQKVRWVLGIGYTFSLPTGVYLIVSRQKIETDSPRTQLLKAVQKEVKERLEYSLHNEKLINLSKQAQADRATDVNPNSQPLLKRFELQVRRLLQNSEEQSTLIDSDTEIINIFKHPDVNQQLLILGAPGAGKTTTLLQLARELITLARSNENEPIPVLLDLSAWKEKKQAIDEFIVAELKDKYAVPAKLSKHLLDKHQLIPLLDGLDKLKEKLSLIHI